MTTGERPDKHRERPSGNRAISMVTLDGPAEIKVVAPVAYAGSREMTAALGPLLLVVKSPEAWKAAREWMQRSLALGDRVFPEATRDEFDRGQEREDRHIAATGEVPLTVRSRTPQPDVGMGF